jgi:hypothetical protein
MGMGSYVRTLSVRVKEVRNGDRAILDFSLYHSLHQTTSEPAVPA